MKTALITGVTGQDGSYLAELLLSKGYAVFGTKRRGSSFNTQRIDHLMDHDHFILHYSDMTDPMSVRQVLDTTQPDEIYNLAAQSHVAVSFDMPAYTISSVVDGTVAIVEWMRRQPTPPRLYQASSSEMFGNAPSPQGCATVFAPCSPYACAKVMAHHICGHYRDAYGLFIACGILFNHESPRRGETFVTRKITRGLARMQYGLQQSLHLGNMMARRDWGYAPEYVEAVWRLLQRDNPIDTVVGTGESASVEDFLHACLEMVDGKLHDHVVRGCEDYQRIGAEVNHLQADTRHATVHLNWRAKTHWRELAKIMMAADLVEAAKEVRVRKCAV